MQIPSNRTSSPGGTVLVVDDHAAVRESIAALLESAGYGVQIAASAVEGLTLLKRTSFNVVVTDMQMPGMSGLEFIQRIVQAYPTTQTVMVTAYASISTAVQAMRLGAFDYIEKPIDAERLEKCVQQACERGNLLRPLRPNKSANSSSYPIVGACDVMQKLRQRIEQIAQTNETVLICGESGTGKELVAQAIHQLSQRANGPLVSLNCPVLSAQLMESELFGHKKGAFTGADSDRIGRFELATNGTLLLDEITEIDLSLQAKLLRVLQERTFERVGSSETIRTEARVVATTNRELASEIQSGRFREDLYYRLAVLPLVVPPLRDRIEDVKELCEYFLHNASERLQREPVAIQKSALDLMQNYHWPGNVRELQNLITRACVLADSGSISAEQIRPWLQESPHAIAKDTQGSSSSCLRIAENESQKGISGSRDTALNSPTMHDSNALPVGETLGEVERKMIEATLVHFNGHRAKTAKALGIGVRTLSNKLRAFGYAPGEKNFRKAA